MSSIATTVQVLPRWTATPITNTSTSETSNTSGLIEAH